tara:strand:+ start:10370 stop:14395 length:4026 start_codon:yes stop_codon:yes gene_type:complete
MPQSDVSQVTFFQEYYLGDPPPFFTSIEDVQSSTSVIQITGIPAFLGYPYLHDVPSSPPNPDRILTSVTLDTQSGVDADGVQYGGNFRPDTDEIIVVGNLDPAEELAVRNALTINEGNLANNRVTDEYVVNTFGLAGIGIADFGYIIPYSERDIVVPGDTIEIPFFRMTNNGAPRETRVVVSSVAPRQLAIDDGTETISESVMSVENIGLPGERDFDQLTARVTASNFEIIYDESTVNKLIFSITPRNSVYPQPTRWESSITSTYSTIEIGLEFDFSINASGIASRLFKSRPYAIRDPRPNTDSAGFFRPPRYGQVVCTNGLSFNWIRNTNDILMRLVTYSSVPAGRQAFGIMTFRNNFGVPISFEVDKIQNRIRIEGEDVSGTLQAQIFLFATYTTLESIAQAVNDWIATIDGWDDVSLVVNRTEINNYVASEFLDGVTATDVNDTLDLSTTIDPISLNDPNYTWTVPLNDNTTFREILDVRASYENAYGQSLRLPVSDTEYGGMPDTWKDFPGLPKCLNNGEGDTSPGYRSENLTTFSGLFITNSRNDPSRFLYYYQETDTVNHSNFTTIQSVCDFLNSEAPFIQSTPGLYYGDVNSMAVAPNGTWRREGNTSLADIPETTSTDANKIVIRGGQDRIGGTATFPLYNLEDDFTTSIAGSTQTVDELSAIISARYPGIVSAGPLNGNGSVEVQEFGVLAPTSIANSGESAVIEAEFEQPRVASYQLDNFGTIESLVSTINQEWNSRDLVASIDTGTSDRPDAIPGNLNSFDVTQDMTVADVVFTGNVSAIDPPAAPREFIYLDYNLNWVGDVGPNIDEQGIQVALGGYRNSDGEYFINPAPNAFFEPGFNTLFDVTFSVIEADEIYILARTRQDVDATSYTSNPSDYQGLTRFSNGFPSEVTNGTQLNGSPFDVWEDADWNGGNTPAVFIIPAEANIMTLFADDTAILDSIQVQINNFPAELDEFAFLALNRTNLNASMTESQQGRVFGLVLDNRGIWDVLIGPEAEIRRVLDGEFDYLNFSFDHTTIDSDEAYNFEFFNSDNIDPAVLAAIDVIPVPGFPRVAVLRIEAGVKRYLSQLRAAAPANSLDGCSVDIDILVEGRESGAQGIARVTAFADYTCVFDIGLCDFFWNLTDPPNPEPPDAIENTLVISYQDYIDCQRLDVDGDGDNARLSFPLLITVEGVPVFETGNALLLIKGTYSASVEGYFFPSRSDFGTIQNPECGDLSDNEPLSDRLNQELVFIEDEDEPITDPVRISQIINGDAPYLYIKPRFLFPGIDTEFECGPNEIVIASIGYQFQDWEPGLRQDDILIGVDSIISNSTFSAPELEFCYKYYYRRET